jgi:antitoxin (DNA-binding transcriptional repressor) of toxin-antitoxin stability system
MKPMTARELKNATGEVVRALRRGETIMLTFRGRPLGTIAPLQPEERHGPSVPAYDEAWTRIEEELGRSTPRFASWRQAEEYSRGRP